MSIILGRISLSSTSTESPSFRYASVLFRGPVPPTRGEWLGVEWDDGNGKHSGVYEKTGVKYFSCREGAGSFLRPNAPGVSHGTSFLLALHSKYLDETLEGDSSSTFHATNSNFDIEVPSLSRNRDKFRHLEKLKEVGLENKGVNGVGTENEAVKASAELPKLAVLNLSYTLFSSFASVADIVSRLPSLHALALNSNRFNALQSTTFLAGFQNLTSLQLNHTLVSWSDVALLAPSLPSLEELQLGSNQLQILEPSLPEDVFPNLRSLNLEENELIDWKHISDRLSPLPKLEQLFLSQNRLPSISPTKSTLRTLKYLALTNNGLLSWSDIDALNTLTSLEGLRCSGNPLYEGLSEDRQRLFTIGRVKGLKQLEGSTISPMEREDAEVFYLADAQIGRGDLSDEDFHRIHPRLRELVALHGREAPPPPRTANIKSKLIQLNVEIPKLFKQYTLACLPTQLTRLMRTQVSRLVGVPLPKTKWHLVASLQPRKEGEDDAFGGSQSLRLEIPVAEEGRQLDWWGLRDGDSVQILEVT